MSSQPRNIAATPPQPTARKYLIQKEAVCSECVPAAEYAGDNVDAWAKRHARETGHIVTIHETHDVAIL